MGRENLRLIAALLLAVTLGFHLPSRAAVESEILLVYDDVRKKFPDFGIFCKLSEEDRRKTVTQATMALASMRKVSDPFGAGPQAGVRLRRDCGLDPAVDMNKIRWTFNAPPLSFHPERGSLGPQTAIQDLANRVYTPAGAGPFPAVVISQTKGMSEHLRVHARELVDSGFAVLVVDTFGPRNYKIGINEPLPAEFAKDAYDALSHLLSLPYIDKNRIFQTGYSFGGMASALLASPEGAIALGAKSRFRATVANYGSCSIASPYSGSGSQATQMDMLSVDSDRPILMLMAELDIETPPQNCFPRLEEMKAAGKDVQWHIYPRTTHGWDKAEHNGHVYRTTSGQSMVYRYDSAVSKDATERMIAFFNRYR